MKAISQLLTMLQVNAYISILVIVINQHEWQSKKGKFQHFFIVLEHVFLSIHSYSQSQKSRIDLVNNEYRDLSFKEMNIR